MRMANVFLLWMSFFLSCLFICLCAVRCCYSRKIVYIIFGNGVDLSSQNRSQKPKYRWNDLSESAFIMIKFLMDL